MPAKKQEKKEAKKAEGKPSPRYDAKQAEPKWQAFWEKNKIFSFDPKRGPIFSIDTPPPYPTGEAHPGYVLNWGYIDFIARYKRMKGFAVHFPQGWDVHGLPTEVKVEKWKGKKSGEVPRETWVKWCEEWTEKYIKLLKADFLSLGFSIDWSFEYKTSMPDYIALVQRSFLKHFEKGLAYRGKHPVNWCPNCQTAIADAEVAYKTRDGSIWHVKFQLAGGGEIIIATTRPELLCACVGIAVHPDDEKNKQLIGRRVHVPIFGQEVEIFGSETVDPNFGTGIVMICTFGDKADVDWVFKHGLPIIDALDETGKLTGAAVKYQGLSAKEAKEIVAKDLIEAGLVVNTERIEQNVGLCWRCSNPIEILNKEQWFLKAVQFKERVIHEANRCNWFPEHMKLRLINWATSMNWDWVISRQKVYGTPIPIWYCDFCGNIIAAEEKELPADPALKGKKCPKCKKPCRGEIDTMDTWMDSSATTYWHAGWPKPGWERLVPATLQPNGAEIIRTWDYYLLLRSIMLEDRSSFENLMINGWVTDETGEKMSKSLGNYTPLPEMLKRSYADAVRYWASRSVVGSDVPFTWAEIQHAEKFFTKLWNIFGFLNMATEKTGINITKMKSLGGKGGKKEIPRLELIDKWILSKLQGVIEKSTESMDKYSWPVIEIENFVWHEVADYYIEMIKHRIYGGANPEAALWALKECILNSIKLLAPFAPHITEEIYQASFAKEGGKKSIHISEWPKVEKDLKDDSAEKLGEMAKDVIACVRQFKMTNKLPLNATIKELVIECEELKSLAEDIKGTLKAEKIIFTETDELHTLQFNIGVSAKL